MKTHTKWEAIAELDRQLLNELEKGWGQRAATLAHRFDVGESKNSKGSFQMKKE